MPDNFHVSWEIDAIHADSHHDAARQVREMLADPESIALVFMVTGENGVRTKVDLWDRDRAADNADSVKLPTMRQVRTVSDLQGHLRTHHDTDANTNDQGELLALHAEYHENARTNGWPTPYGHTHDDEPTSDPAPLAPWLADMLGILDLDAFMAQHGTPDDDTDDCRFDAEIAYRAYRENPLNWQHPHDANGLDPVGQMIATEGPWWHPDVTDPIKTWTYSQVNPGGADISHEHTFTGTDAEWNEHLVRKATQGCEVFNAKEG